MSFIYWLWPQQLLFIAWLFSFTKQKKFKIIKREKKSEAKVVDSEQYCW